MANGQLDFADIRRDIERNNAQWIAGDNPIWQLSEEQQLRRLGAAEPAHFRFPGPIYYHQVPDCPIRSIIERSVSIQES